MFKRTYNPFSYFFFLSKSSFALSYKSSKPPLAYRLMDPSSETTYAMLGIGGSVNFPVQVLSSHALLQEQSSQDSSRRILFPLKTDNFIRCKKKKKKSGGRRRNVCVCMCENIWATVARPLHIEWWKNVVVQIATMFCYGCFFSKGSPSACILVTKN